MIFRVQRKEAFDHIICNGNYECNKKAFQDNLAQFPEHYPNWQELPSITGKEYLLIIWHEISALTVEEAKDIIIANKKMDVNWSLATINGIELVSPKTLTNYKENKLI